MALSEAQGAGQEGSALPGRAALVRVRARAPWTADGELPVGVGMILVREPDAGDPHVRFDERRLETESRRGVRHRPRAKAAGTSYPLRLPPPRQSSTLLNWIVALPSHERRESAARRGRRSRTASVGALARGGAAGSCRRGRRRARQSRESSRQASVARGIAASPHAGHVAAHPAPSTSFRPLTHSGRTTFASR